jgi:prevent-host-death family protein
MVINNSGAAIMITIPASEFKAKCLALMDQVARTGETIVISKHGRAIAELKAHRAPRVESLIGLQSGRIKVTGDILTSVGDSLWNAEK